MGGAARAFSDYLPMNPGGNVNVASISSCNDLPGEIIDADGLVLVRGPIICDQTKVRVDGSRAGWYWRIFVFGKSLCRLD